MTTSQLTGEMPKSQNPKWRDVQRNYWRFPLAVWYFAKTSLHETFHVSARHIAAMILEKSAIALSYIGIKKLSLRMELAAARLGLHSKTMQRVAGKSKEYSILLRSDRQLSENEFKLLTGRILVLKWPIFRSNAVVEKGVLFVKFTETFRMLSECMDCQTLLDYFDVVFEPSWVGYALPEVLSWASFTDGNLFVESADRADFEFIETLGRPFTPIALGSGDWFDSSVFTYQKGGRREYDVVYVANYSIGKRVIRFLDLAQELSTMGNYRCALVCSSWGGNRQHVANLSMLRGQDRYFDLYEDLSPAELNQLLNSSRVNVLLSLREGSNRSLFEAMAAGACGVLLEQNVGVNRSSIVSGVNGEVLQNEGLSEGIAQILADIDSYRPAEWANHNSGGQASTLQLEEKIRETRAGLGERFTGHLTVKVNRPEAQLIGVESSLSRRCAVMLMDQFSVVNTQTVSSSTIVNAIESARRVTNSQ